MTSSGYFTMVRRKKRKIDFCSVAVHKCVMNQFYWFHSLRCIFVLFFYVACCSKISSIKYLSSCYVFTILLNFFYCQIWHKGHVLHRPDHNQSIDPDIGRRIDPMLPPGGGGLYLHQVVSMATSVDGLLSSTGDAFSFNVEIRFRRRKVNCTVFCSIGFAYCQFLRWSRGL